MPSVLTPQQLENFDQDGYLIIPSFFDREQGNDLLQQARKLLTEFDVKDHPMTKFSTGEKDKHVGDDYFLDSGDKIRFFFEEDAFDSQGILTRPKEEAINKIGHGLHEVDAVFRKFTLDNQRLKDIARDLGVHRDPLVLQSMVICKQPGIGGKVPIHDDSTFLYTDPPSALGFWFALENCTLSPQNNGCLSFVPGSHKRNRIAKRFVRMATGGTGFERIDGVEDNAIEWEKESWVTEECDAGTLVLINGKVIHKSEKNISPASRFIYTFHMIEGDGSATYDDRNWLQPTPDMPFSRLFSS